MSEYWVSKKKYLCKYCDIYIADDVPSRQQHENGLRHKGNVERFIRGIYKDGVKRKKGLEEEEREIKRVEQAANAAFAQDVGAGLAKATSSPIASSSNAPKKPVAKPSNPFTNYSTAQSLGYEDVDAERIAAQLQLRRSQGVAGEWQIITPPQAPVAPTSLESTAAAEPDRNDGLKREAEVPPEEDSRSFKLRKKSLNPGLGEIYDPGLIPIKVKKKEVQEKEIEPAVGSSSSSLSSKWAKPQWSAPLPDIKLEERGKIFGVAEKPTEDSPTGQGPEFKVEPDITEEGRPLQPDTSNTLLTESLFKKRKTPGGSARGRRHI